MTGPAASKTSTGDPSADDAAAEIKAHARILGFDVCGITHPDGIANAGARLRAFLADGRHGDMDWMAQTAERRADPRTLWPRVRAIIMVGHNYGPDTDPLAALADTQRAAISAYAGGKDYHDIIKTKLKQLGRFVVARTGGDVKVFVDTAPLMEKPLAQAAGIGWQGKHTNLVSRDFGSWLFLGAVLTTAQLPADPSETDHCGRCRACLDICPTDAFPAPYQLDARRCIAYLTIEAKGQIAPEFRKAIGNRVFGCDDCLAVCPWNKFAKRASEQRYAARADTDNPPLDELLRLSDAAFRERFAGTPIKRTGRDRVVRNALIAAGNSGDCALVPACRALLDDPSALVRGIAVWALGELCDAGEFDSLAAHRSVTEPDAQVRAEWDAARARSRAKAEREPNKANGDD